MLYKSKSEQSLKKDRKERKENEDGNCRGEGWGAAHSRVAFVLGFQPFTPHLLRTQTLA